MRRGYFPVEQYTGRHFAIEQNTVIHVLGGGGGRQKTDIHSHRDQNIASHFPIEQNTDTHFSVEQHTKNHFCWNLSTQSPFPADKNNESLPHGAQHPE